MQDRMQAPALVAWLSPFSVAITPGRAQAGSRHCFGALNQPVRPHGTPFPRPDRGRRSGIQRDVSHTGPLIFRQLPFKCTTLPGYLMISSPPDDSLKPSRRNLHECNRCFLTSQATHGFSLTGPDCVSHTLPLPLSGVRVASHAQPDLSLRRPTRYGFSVVRHHRIQSRGLRGSGDTAARETASRQLRRDEHLPLGDDDHLVQTFGSPSKISRACPTRSSHGCRIPVAVVLASRDHTAFCFPPT